MNRKVKMDPILHFVPPIEGEGLAACPFFSCKTPVYPTLGLLLCKRNSIQMYLLIFLFPFAQICYHFLFAERKTWSLLCRNVPGQFLNSVYISDYLFMPRRYISYMTALAS